MYYYIVDPNFNTYYYNKGVCMRLIVVEILQHKG